MRGIGLVGGDVDEHEGFAVSLEVALKEMGQFAVSVRYVFHLFLDSVDHAAQVAQRFVDALCLLHSIASDIALLYALTSREVDQHQRTIPHLFCGLIDSLQPQSDDEMRSAGFFIHVGRSSLPIDLGLPQM